jgi:hypothetical protein
MAANEGLQESILKRWKVELTNKGIEFPADINYDDLKALVMGSRKPGEKAPMPRPHQERAMEKQVKATDADIEKRVAEMVQKQMDALRKEMLAMSPQVDIAAAVGSAVDKVLKESKADQVDEYGLVDPKFIPNDDYLSSPKVYYMPTNTRRIRGYQRGNVWVRPPHGWKSILFEKAHGWMERHPEGNKQKIVSTFVCWSKAISEFLESCPEFNVVFYLNLDEALSLGKNGTYVEMFNRHFGGLSARTYGELTALAPQWGVPTNITFSRDHYAKLIAEKMADKEMSEYESLIGGALQKTLQAVDKADLLTRQPAHA